jgi:hypothetical protein
MGKKGKWVIVRAAAQAIIAAGEWLISQIPKLKPNPPSPSTPDPDAGPDSTPPGGPPGDDAGPGPSPA